MLSFGATKGGALAAEAIVFFDPAQAAMMAERRKRAGHLVSKHRFIAAQLEAFLADGLWLDLARHANRMADRLAATLEGLGLAPVWKVEANLVFVLLPQGLHEHLQAAGAQYYAFHSDSLPGGKGHPRRPRARPPRHVVCDHRSRHRGLRRPRKTNAIAPKLRLNPGLGYRPLGWPANSTAVCFSRRRRGT